VTETLLILLGAILVNNFVLVQFLGLCPFMGVSNRLETAMSMSLATTFVLTLASVASWLVHHLVLVPLGLEYLQIIAFILVIAALVQFTEMVVKWTSPLLYRVLGVFLPLITVNCAILGASLFMVERDYTFGESVVFGLGAGVGWALAIVALAGVREKLKYSDVPEGLRGLGITFISVGLISLCFMSFGGIDL
jgi:electron transport complex protein RnfA